MKTVKLKNVNKGGWKVKPEDRLNLSSIQNSAKVSEALGKVTDGLAKSMEKQIAIIDKIAKHMDGIVKQIDRRPAAIAPAATQNIEVIIPPGKKRTFRCTPVRGDDDRIIYVDIQQL
jgi:hypothetical protein